MNQKINHCYQGDCRTVIRELADSGIQVQTVVTSPPYYRLRDYGMPGQIGQEVSPDEYITNLVNIFRGVRELLANDGTLWLNMGDTYAAKRSYQVSATKHPALIYSQNSKSQIPHDMKPKDLMGIPWRLAFALRDDGWYLRQDIIWAKPNPMPESVTDRCTKSHEYVFLLSKSPRYYFDAEAISEPVTESTVKRLSQPNLLQQAGSDRVPGKTNGPIKAAFPRFGGHKYGNDPSQQSRTKSGNVYESTGRRNKRSVWWVTTTPFKGAHFAVFPEQLIEPCILAGSRPGDIVLDPFMGAGTVAVVASKHQRHWLGIELNPAYIALQHERMSRITPERGRL